MSNPEVITLGCRLNGYESEVIRRHAADAGLTDCVVINTCAVTGEAVRQARQTIRRLRRERPSARIIVTGCAAQTEPEIFAEMDEVDHIIGNEEKLQATTFTTLALGTTERVSVNNIMDVRESALHLVDAFDSKVRAYVQIQNGCDHRCTFCIIPFGRGPSRSIPAGEIVNQIRQLAAQGHQEVVLTGVDLTDYGRGLPGDATLGKLAKQILKLVPELPRLRLSSIDQVEVDTHLMDVIANEPRLMPHFHLSLQSGDDLILKRMKRRHLRRDAINFCEQVRNLRPDVVFGADLIAGFPTETADMFQNTLNIIDDCELTYLHVFPYSARKGTPAARMPQVNGRDIKARAAQLREKSDAALRSFLDHQAGSTIEVLIEGTGIGRTPHFAALRITDHDPVPGTLHQVEVTGHDGKYLFGKLVA